MFKTLTTEMGLIGCQMAMRPERVRVVCRRSAPRRCDCTASSVPTTNTTRYEMLFYRALESRRDQSA